DETAGGELEPPNDSVRRAIRRLPERQRLALFLRYYADLDYESIARVLDIRPGTVAAALHAAHETLRGSLQEVSRCPTSIRRFAGTSSSNCRRRPPFRTGATYWRAGDGRSGTGRSSSRSPRRWLSSSRAPGSPPRSEDSTAGSRASPASRRRLPTRPASAPRTGGRGRPSRPALSSGS